MLARAHIPHPLPILSLTPCPLYCAGSSAGAINATYFLSGQNHGVDIYHDKIACEEFISLRRLWKGDREGTPVLNLPFLIDHVMQSECPLDWQAVLGSPIPLKVGTGGSAWWGHGLRLG